MNELQLDAKKRKTYRIAKKDGQSDDAPPNEERTDEHTVPAVDPDASALNDEAIDCLIPDIEDYLNEALSTQESAAPAALPPVVRFRKNWTLSVTDLSSQLWCEKQTELTLVTGRKRVTKEMEQGTERHEQLELEDHEIVEVEVETNEEVLGIKLLNSINLVEQLLDTGKCRELWLFANFNGYVLRGVIDQLEIVRARPSGAKQVRISDTKTRSQRRKPGASQMQGAALQVQLYCLMLERMRRGDVQFAELYKAFECDKDAPFVSEELLAEGCLAQLEQRFRAAFKRLPEVATTMQLSYEHQGEVFDTSDIPLREASTMYTVHYLFDFWDGHRDAEPVNRNEAWKCKMCEFKDECEASPLLKTTPPKQSPISGQTSLDSFFRGAARTS
ncbi:exonuclease V, mitochondrial, putative [Babesia caballi]|uniref:Exonuclease V, mitochondrial, putative n=1 Tax=Babesia caballi TaxID=5871 RepID=A0AAV4LRC5_BABCB|nr:exonuclease V, mitochondrial, putative [Babesia caballi]